MCRRNLVEVLTVWNPFRAPRHICSSRRKHLLEVISPYKPGSNPHRHDQFMVKLVNAVILACLAFFKTLISLGTATSLLGLSQSILANPTVYLLAASIMAGLEFFSYLALARGIYIGPE